MKELVVKDLTKPEGVQGLKDFLRQMQEDLNIIYTTTAPNGNITASRGTRALYNNSGVYTTWINTDGGTTWQEIGKGFVERGDPSAWDFRLDGSGTLQGGGANPLTTDGAWHDLDLSALVPAGAAVVIVYSVSDNLVAKSVGFRKNGNVNTPGTIRIRTEIADDYEVGGTPPIVCDSDSKIEFWASDTTWTVIDLVIIGWWV